MCVLHTFLYFLYAAVTEGSGLSTSNLSSQDKDNQASLTTSSIPSYISDFEDNTVATATLGVSMATTVGSGDPHTVKSDTKKDTITTATDHVSEDMSSEGDTLVEHNNSSQLDSTLQNGKRCSYLCTMSCCIVSIDAHKFYCKALTVV